MYRLFIVVFTIFLAPNAWSDSAKMGFEDFNFALSFVELERDEIMANHACAPLESDLECLNRSCNLVIPTGSDGLGTNDIGRVLYQMNALKDTDRQCIFKDSTAGKIVSEFIKSWNKAAIAGLKAAERAEARAPRRASSPRPLLRPENLVPERSIDIANDASTSFSSILLEAQKESLNSPITKITNVPLTDSEIETFRTAVQRCWSVNSNDRAGNVSVTIGFQLSPEGRVVASSLEMLSYSGGTQSEANIGFSRARRAILRCQRDGYDLPKDKYAYWKNIELKFEP